MTSIVKQLRHDLRTPMNAILGYSEMLIEDVPGLATELAAVVAHARVILSAIETHLPPSREAIYPTTRADLGAAFASPQRAILATVRQLQTSPAVESDECRADLARVEDAAVRLLTILDAGTTQRVKSHDPDASAPAEAPTVIRLAAASPPVRTVADAASPCHILVVDDVAENREVLERRLVREGHRVSCAVDGRDALERVQSAVFDLILLDILMPTLDGVSVLRQLKAQPETRDIPVIMISSLDDVASVVRCIEAGAEDHLPKPFDAVLLRARITASLEKKRLRDREREYVAEVKGIAAAAVAVERGAYDPASLSRTALRADELGTLARVFDGMAAEVKAREDRLRREVDDLRQQIQLVRMRAVADESGEGRLAIGQRLGTRYEIRAVAGVGAMGAVYRAFDRELEEEVALKVVRPELLSDPGVLERFKAEVRLARRISHPAVVRTHDFGDVDGIQFLTMEYVEGVTARSLLDSRGQLSVDSSLALIRQLVEALVAAHTQGVVHRDIKPQNLLIDARGSLKVMDFGVSQLTGSREAQEDLGLAIGTPAYMAPEQLLGEDVDARADLYATGVVLFECLTGRLPFEADSVRARTARVLRESPPLLTAFLPQVSPQLTALVERLLARRREDRPATSQELLGLLHHASRS